MNYTEELVRESAALSAALIDLAFDLEQQRAVVDGTITSTFLSPKQAERLIGVTLQEIAGALSLRTKSLARYEENEKLAKAEKFEKEKKDQELRVLALQLPAEWNPMVEGNRISTKLGASLSIEAVYATSGRHSWRVGLKVGEKLIVSCNYEDKRFPRKKDGTFSMDKAIEFIRSESSAKAARETREGQELQKRIAFKRIVGPYYEYGIYGTEQDWNPSENFHLKARAIGDGEYAVSRTVTEYVTGEQLAAILEREVGKVKKEQEA